MSLNAATIEFLLAKGLTGEDLLEVARRSEMRSDPTAAARKRKQRENEKSQRDVTRDMVPPKDINQTPSSVPFSNENGDPEKILFDQGIAILAAGGVKEPKARQLIGKWKKDHGAPNVISALSAAKREGAIEPISFIEAALRRRQRDPPSMAMPC